MPSDRRFVMKSDVWNGLASITDFGSALCRSMNISVLTTRRISGPGMLMISPASLSVAFDSLFCVVSFRIAALIFLQIS